MKDIQVVIKKQFRAVVARGKRLVKAHKAGKHLGQGAGNCQLCRV